MADAILVLNAGSSSIKFSLFLEQGGGLEPRLSGLLEGLYTGPRFTAKDAAGASLGEKAWGEGTRLGHDGAVAHLVEFLGAQRAEHRLVAVGHRVVHGGLDFTHEAPRQGQEPLIVEGRRHERHPERQARALAPGRNCQRRKVE